MIALGGIPTVGQSIPFRPLVGIGRVALPVVVVLGVRVVVTDELLVYFIQVIGFQYHTTDHPFSRGGFEPDLDFAEEDVEFGLDGRGVASLGDGEGGTRGVVG